VGITNSTVHHIRLQCFSCGREGWLDDFIGSKFDPAKLFAAALVGHARPKQTAEEVADSGETPIMSTPVQNAVCAFAREIVAARRRERLDLVTYPDVDNRNSKAPDELWQSPTLRYAVEHTLIESFDGQRANGSKIEHLLLPVKHMLADVMPGYFVLTVRERDTATAQVGRDIPHVEIAMSVLAAAIRLSPGETITLPAKQFPFEMSLHLRHQRSCGLVVRSDISGDPADLRAECVRRAFDHASLKFPAWIQSGHRTLLVLEADDFQHSNVFVNFATVKRVLSERTDHPDLIVFVETDGSPMYGWIFKEGDRLGDDAPMPNGRRCYTEGQVR
jgi:hypothetical protein